MIAPPEQIAEFIRTIAVPGSITELRSTTALVSGWFDDFDLMAEQAHKLSAAGETAYMTINPCLRPDEPLNRLRSGRATGEKGIEHRARMLIDIDPVRAANTSATDVEKELALNMARAVRETQRRLGWPEPAFVDSGNGYHLYYAIDLQASDTLVPQVLKALDSKFSTDFCLVDTAVGNASRIAKVPGTLANKGENSPERPHRTSFVIDRPQEWVPVSIDQLKAELPPPAPPRTVKTPHTGNRPGDDFNARGDDLDDILRRHGWTLVRSSFPRAWRRPGKESGTLSATELHGGIRVFSSNAEPFAVGWHDRFGVYARLEHGGDFAAASRALALKGFGDQRNLDAQRLAAAVEGVDGPPKPRIEFITHEDFCRRNYFQKFLVKGILVEGQPCIVGGGHKTMKTNTCVLDLGISLGFGTRFLGQFEVPEPVSTLILSGESGGFTLQRNMRDILRARNMQPSSPAPIYWGFKLPQLSSPDHLAALGDAISENSIKVCIIDPAYLCLLSGTQGRQASNLFDMGSVLQGLTDLGQETGCTFVMLHHFKKSMNPMERFGMPELSDLSMSGFGEWARQWILLNRRERYEPSSGVHRLWMTVGGSAGHGGNWSLDIDEGVMDEDFGGRKWEVSVNLASEAVEREQIRKVDAKAQKAEREFDSRRQKVYDELRRHPEGMTKSKLRITKLNSVNINTAIDSLMDEGLLEECRVKDSQNKTQTVYKLKPEEMEKPFRLQSAKMV